MLLFVEGRGFLEVLGGQLPWTVVTDLYNRAENIANRTGVNLPSLLMHILANTRLVCKRYEVKLGMMEAIVPSGRDYQLYEVYVIFRHGLNAHDMRTIHQVIKEEYGKRKAS